MLKSVVKWFCRKRLMGRHVNSSMASLWGRSIYGSVIHEGQKTANPLVRAVYHGIAVPLANFQNFLADHCLRRFNVVDLKCKPAFYDPDFRIEIALFTIIGDFCEHELGRQSEIERSTDYDPTDYEFYKGYRLHSTGIGDRMAVDAWTFFLQHETAIRGKSWDQDDPLEDQKDMHLKNIVNHRNKFWV